MSPLFIGKIHCWGRSGDGVQLIANAFDNEARKPFVYLTAVPVIGILSMDTGEKENDSFLLEDELIPKFSGINA